MQCFVIAVTGSYGTIAAMSVCNARRLVTGSAQCAAMWIAHIRRTLRFTGPLIPEMMEYQMSKTTQAALNHGAIAAPRTTVCSGFLRESIESRLQELRDDVALQLHLERHALGPRWARSARSTQENQRNQGHSDPYWDGIQRDAIEERRQAVKDSEQALRDFIAEHRYLMGQEWIGNDHGRLCFMTHLGGFPIDRHYCQRQEGHDGFCQNDKGAWPCGCESDYDVRQLQAVCKHVEVIDWNDERLCSNCGKRQN